MENVLENQTYILRLYRVTCDAIYRPLTDATDKVAQFVANRAHDTCTHIAFYGAFGAFPTA